MECYLSFDFGTTNFKSILYDTHGNALYTSEAPVPLTVNNERHEQHPDELLSIVKQLFLDQINYAADNNIALHGIGLSAAMHGIIAVGDNDELLSNLIVWSDNRCHQETEWLKTQQYDQLIYHNSGTPVHTMLPVAKILWFQQNEPILYKKVRKFVSFKEWLMKKWFGDYYADYGIAAASGLYSFSRCNWNDKLLSGLGILPDMLGEVVAPDAVFTNWDSNWLNALKTNALPPVVIGGADGCLAMLGSGIFDEKYGSITIGTSGAIRTINNAPKFDGLRRTFCYPVNGDLYVAGTPVNNGGNVVEWLRKQWNIDANEFWKDFEASLKTIEPGSSGLSFIPYMNGERAPFWDAGLQASFLGMNMAHERHHMIKAVAEGVTYNLAENLDILQEQKNIDALIADGGFVKSTQWVQLLADVFNKKIYISGEQSSASRGAALIAKYALTGGKSLTNVFNQPELVGCSPNHHRVNTYKDLKKRFVNLRDRMLENGLMKS